MCRVSCRYFKRFQIYKFSRAKLNFRTRPILCTTLYRKPENQHKRETSVAHSTNFSFEFFFVRLSHKMPLHFFPCCKEVKNDQKLKAISCRLTICSLESILRSLKEDRHDSSAAKCLTRRRVRGTAKAQRKESFFLSHCKHGLEKSRNPFANTQTVFDFLCADAAPARARDPWRAMRGSQRAGAGRRRDRDRPSFCRHGYKDVFKVAQLRSMLEAI